MSLTSHFRTRESSGYDVRKRRVRLGLHAYLRHMEQAMSKARQERQAPRALSGGSLVYKWVDSPVGRLKLVATDEGLAAILWAADRPGRVRLKLDAEDAGH